MAPPGSCLFGVVGCGANTSSRQLRAAANSGEARPWRLRCWGSIDPELNERIQMHERGDATKARGATAPVAPG